MSPLLYTIISMFYCDLVKIHFVEKWHFCVCFWWSISLLWSDYPVAHATSDVNIRPTDRPSPRRRLKRKKYAPGIDQQQDTGGVVYIAYTYNTFTAIEQKLEAELLYIHQRVRNCPPQSTSGQRTSGIPVFRPQSRVAPSSRRLCPFGSYF